MIKPLTFLLCKQQMLSERREKSVQNHAKHPAALSGSVVRGVGEGETRTTGNRRHKYTPECDVQRS